MHDTSAFVYGPERPDQSAAIEDIHGEAFGPGRFARAAFRIREGGTHDLALSFVALHGPSGRIAGSVRLTHVTIGGQRGALLLGPLAVQPDFKNLGAGRKLMAMAVDAARASGARLIVLVGDLPYYAPFGFKAEGTGGLKFPGPVDPRRVLACELKDGALARYAGMIRHAEG
jgi:predicted N-acetyltransferase YhbS